MYQCLKCGLEFGDDPPDYCPVCHTICFVCPWCGRVTDASTAQCTLPDCGQPIKYVRMTPDMRDIMRLSCGEVISIAHVEVKIERALYSSSRVTVYRGRVIHSRGGRKSEPSRNEVVIVREVMDECTPQVQSVISKLLSVRHPNIVKTYAGQSDEERSCYYLLQSWIGERSLASAHLQEEGGRAPENVELGKIAVSLAKAVEYLHTRGIIHCDITPFNVLLTDSGTPVLSDFGIATVTEAPSEPRGHTPGYAPIEMCLPSDVTSENWRLGSHTDRYMLGTTLYSIACGRDGRSLHPVTLTPVIVHPVDRLKYDTGADGSPQIPLASLRRDIDGRMADWIETLISIRPEDRFNSDADMVKRVVSLSKRIGKRRILPGKPGRWMLRKPLKAFMLILCALVLVFCVRHSYSIRHSPKNLVALGLSDFASVLGKRKAAVQILECAPISSAEVSYRIGRLHERSGSIEEALTCYKKSAGLDTDYSPAKSGAERVRRALGAVSLHRGLQLYHSGEYYLARRQLAKALRYGSNSEAGYRVLAAIAERRGDLMQAAEYWDAVSKLAPSAVGPHYKSASLYESCHRTSEAYYHALKARDLHSKSEPKENVSSDDLDALLSDISAACLKAGSMNIAKSTDIRQISEKIVWLCRAKDLRATPSVYRELAEYYRRLGDLSSGDRRASYYAQAADYASKAKYR